MTQQSKKEERGLFTQFPVILLDEYAGQMPPTSFVAFMKFYRHFGYKGIFKGSIRRLSKILEMAKSSIDRAIADWVRLGLVRKSEQKKIEENRDEMILLIEGNDLWGKNIEHSKSLGWCPKLGQSAPADDPPVPENHASVPDWDKSGSNGDAAVPDLNNFVPASSSKSPPYITEENSKITLDKTEDRDDDPMPSPPDDSSFIHSSDLHASSEQDAHSPATVNPKPLHEAPPIAIQTGEETQNEHNDTSPGAQGYKTNDSSTVEPLDHDAQIAEQQLLDWVKAAGVALGLPASCAKAVDVLLPLVHGPNDIEKLVKIERKIHPTGIIYIANLARAEVVQGLRSTARDQAAEESYTPSDKGMSLVERDELVAGALALCPDFVISVTVEAPYFVAIYESGTELIEMGAPSDWVRIPEARLKRAASFGARYWQEQAVQREAIAV